MEFHILVFFKMVKANDFSVVEFPKLNNMISLYIHLFIKMIRMNSNGAKNWKEIFIGFGECDFGAAFQFFLLSGSIYINGAILRRINVLNKSEMKLLWFSVGKGVLAGIYVFELKLYVIPSS